MNKRNVLLCLLLSLSLCGCAGKEDIAEATPEPTPEPVVEIPTVYPLLNEAMSRNHTIPLDGWLLDWVELSNPSAETLNLSDFCISKENGGRSTVLEGSLAPGEYLLLTQRELGFGLNKKGETLRLLDRNGNELDVMTLPELQGNESFTRESGITDSPTPGKENRSENAGGSFAPSSLRISEVCTSNTSIRAWSTETCDWIELRNCGEESIRLSEYYLSDDEDELKLWQLPDENLAPGAYKLLPLQEDSAPFGLDAAGEILYLCNAAGAVCDLLDIPYMPADCSYGREGERELFYAHPTPGTANSRGTETQCTAPSVSVPSGWYEESFSVTLSGEGEIRYTTDGSLPNKNSPLYTGEPVAVSKSMSLRARCFDGDRIPSASTTVNYFFDALPLTLDVVKISMSPAEASRDLTKFSVTKSAASIALYVDGVEQFSESCGISVQGSGSRIYEKSSYQIDFRSRYGKTELNYQLFEDLEQDEFTTFALRSGSQDQCDACMRDELISGIFAGCSENLLTFHYRPVSVYLNEEYRGVYYIRERCKPSTVAYRENVSESSVFIVRDINNISTHNEYGAELVEILRYIRSHDFSHQEYYDELAEKLDMDSVTDFFIALLWSTNYDVNNIRFYRSNAHGGHWRLILYDSDVAFYRSNSYWVPTVLQTYTGMLSYLLRNEGYKEQFSRRLSELLKGPLSEERVIERINELEATIANDMVYNCKRYPAILSYKEWQRNVENLRNREGFGVKGWTKGLITQYLRSVALNNELIEELFGAEFVPAGP